MYFLSPPYIFSFLYSYCPHCFPYEAWSNLSFLQGWREPLLGLSVGKVMRGSWEPWAHCSQDLGWAMEWTAQNSYQENGQEVWASPYVYLCSSPWPHSRTFLWRERNENPQLTQRERRITLGQHNPTPDKDMGRLAWAPVRVMAASLGYVLGQPAQTGCAGTGSLTPGIIFPRHFPKFSLLSLILCLLYPASVVPFFLALSFLFGTAHPLVAY